MALKQVFSIILDGQNQIGKEQLLVCIEHHISMGNLGPYVKCFHMREILTECRFYHMDFSVVVYVEFCFMLFCVIVL